jgi:hypothetical protein
VVVSYTQRYSKKSSRALTKPRKEQRLGYSSHSVFEGLTGRPGLPEFAFTIDLRPFLGVRPLLTSITAR